MVYGLLIALVLTVGLGWMLTARWAFGLRATLLSNQRLTKKSQLLEKFYHRDPNPMLHIRKTGHVVYMNPASRPVCEVWQVGLGDTLKEPWLETIRQALTSGYGKAIEVSCGRQTFFLKVDPLVEEGAVNIYGIDVTEKKALEKALTEKTLYDKVTKLPNRTLFHDRLALELSRVKNQDFLVFVFVMQLDDFKAINDAYGESVGNQFLVEITERLKTFATAHTSIARVGDREFGIIETRFTKPSEAVGYVEGFVEKCQQTVEIEGHAVQSAIRVGIAISPLDGDAVLTLTRNARLALSRAVEVQKSHEFYQHDMAEQVEFKRQLLVDLQKATVEKQFVLHFQPQVNLQLGKIMGAEALIRWVHPEKGYISPFFFVGLAEETGLIIEMGEWILDTVCAQIQAWQSSGIRPVQVGVNFSPVQFLKSDVVSQVKRAIDKYQIDPKWIECEITEGAMIHDIEGAIQTMHGLRDLGVELSVDDFGTGYSSLSYLQRFPVHTLKIDQSFVKHIGQNGETPLIPGIINLGHSLNLRIIAEGAETLEQVQYLKKHQCDIIQGYYFGKPMPADKFGLFVDKTWDL